MSFFDYLISVDVRTELTGRMMQKLGVDRQLKTVPTKQPSQVAPSTAAVRAAVRTNARFGSTKTSNRTIRRIIAATVT